jgi:hypothetical protein
MYRVPTPRSITSCVTLAFVLLSSTATEALECLTQKRAVCENDVCRFSSAGDEPLSFSFSSKSKTMRVAFGEGSQSGPLKLVESRDAFVVVSRLGPARLGGRSLGGGNELFVAQIDKKTKTFFAKRSTELLTGSCE